MMTQAKMKTTKRAVAPQFDARISRNVHGILLLGWYESNDPKSYRDTHRGSVDELLCLAREKGFKRVKVAVPERDEEIITL